MSRNQRLLLISYWFPPAGGIAVQRALSLARYLPQHGFDLHVLTPRNPPAPALDPALLELVPAGVRIHRVWSPMPPSQLRKRLWKLISRYRKQELQNQSPAQKKRSSFSLSHLVRRLLCPDPEVVWVPLALRRARQIVKKHEIDTVLVTAPPFSAFLIGNALKREFPSLRLISDFRDEWLRFFLSTFEFQNDGYIRRRAETIERATVTSSDLVITVTSPLVEELRERYRDEPADKFVCIPNGYDPAVFSDFRPRAAGSEKVLVTYVGTVYSTTSPRCYFEALDLLPEGLRSRIETRFIGRVSDDQKHLLTSRGDVKLFGYVPQAYALRFMEETDYLLLIMTDPTHVTGKIYEYLATRKPILAFSPPGGEVARTIGETGGGWCLDPADLESICACLKAVANRELIDYFRPNDGAIQKYERPHLASQFAKVISQTRVPVSAKSAGGR